MKPVRNQNIQKGVRSFYISGVWVGHVGKFVHFVDSGGRLCTEPVLVCNDPGPLPPLRPLDGQYLTLLPPHAGPLPEGVQDGDYQEDGHGCLTVKIM